MIIDHQPMHLPSNMYRAPIQPELVTQHGSFTPEKPRTFCDLATDNMHIAILQPLATRKDS